MFGVRSITDGLKERSKPLTPLDPLLERVGNSRYVLLGEASHGTHEYYTWRTRISQRLILEKGFRFIAVEGDWPSCYELNRYVKGWTKDETAIDVLRRFERWPTWMWSNWEVVQLAEWLRRHNERLPEDRKVCFYGLDVYSLWDSIDKVLTHIQANHPQALQQAHQALTCFEPFNRNEHTYAWSTQLTPSDCEDEVVELLQSLGLSPKAFEEDPEAHFNAEQNAHAAVGAERYYRTMVRADNESWNVRDIHMADTLDRLIQRYGEGAKAIVWEHNTHIGDARATDMADAGMTNIGQLARERHGDEGVFLVGFGSYQGSVIAGDAWGAPIERMSVPEARKGSWEAILHDTFEGEDRLLLLEDFRDEEIFRERRGHRAIGVVYHPDREKYGNYVPTDLPGRYDAFIFVDQSKALHPLQPRFAGTTDEPPETYPWGE